ncbi:MAG: hypothetical protein MUE50_02865 [Pirellulaceae bacterium]|nr:hypothetical protein [Pirellulaceae bacterium]
MNHRVRNNLFAVTFVGCLCGTAICLGGEAKPTSGPLRKHPSNPRYFTDDTGRAILLTGSHTWNNLVDMGPTDPPATFDYDKYLDWLAAYPHNFFRLWTWDLLSWDTRGNREKEPLVHFASPHPWKRTGPGVALDGKPKFDLEAFDDAYFTRLGERVAAAQRRGIYAAVMLFEGWGLQFSPGAWKQHPFHPANNISLIDGDLDGDGNGLEIHTGRSLDITGLQKAYVRKVIDTVNGFDNVLYEISNENHPASTAWQYELIRFIHDYEKTLPKQHPVGMTFQYKGGSNKSLFDSPADWISPNPDGGYRDDPPPADGSKVIVNDTDHLWGIGGNAGWVWKSFLRGLNPIFMDPYDGRVLSRGADPQWPESVRQALGHVLSWSRRVNLAAMAPHGELASSKYCLANPGVEYLIYRPASIVNLTVKLPARTFAVTWFDIANGREVPAEPVRNVGSQYGFTSPVDGDAVLYLNANSH